MIAVRSARFLIGIFLVTSPSLCFAQQTGTGSGVGSGTVILEPADSKTVLIERLENLAEGALPLVDIVITPKAREAWTTEVKRYTERSAELRSRCHEEIRKANRDTIASKSALCLRSDLLLEATHRRKQRDAFASMKGVSETIVSSTTTAIDAWLDASTAIVDGIDTGVFTTVDALKTAKKNLHVTYRLPMQQAFARVRIEHSAAILRSTAAAVLVSLQNEYHPVLETFVPCLEAARVALASQGGLIAGTSQMRSCVEIINDAE